MTLRSSPPCVLAINAGSSTLRFAVFEIAEPLRLIVSGKLDRIGHGSTTLVVTYSGLAPQSPQRVVAPNHVAGLVHVLKWLTKGPRAHNLRAFGHRVVHGMRHTEPERVTSKLLAELRRLTPYDPSHLPRELALIEAIRSRYPRLPQIVCFDTAFHRTMPAVAKLIPIPRIYAKKGVERYGFHGLSYSFLLAELSRLGDPAARRGRVIFAHLGNGASLAAVWKGKCIDTSMGFTPAAGLVMSSRAGDLDPGLLSFLSRTEHMTPTQFEHMVNYESGMLGISETSSDIRDLLRREVSDPRAAEALSFFCYQAKKWIGAYTAALGGLDTLVFAGGIGENSPLIRERICESLGYLGVKLHKGRNTRNARIISTNRARVSVRVIRTDEELMIAKATVAGLPLLQEPTNKL